MLPKITLKKGLIAVAAVLVVKKKIERIQLDKKIQLCPGSYKREQIVKNKGVPLYSHVFVPKYEQNLSLKESYKLFTNPAVFAKACFGKKCKSYQAVVDDIWRNDFGIKNIPPPTVKLFVFPAEGMTPLDGQNVIFINAKIGLKNPVEGTQKISHVVAHELWHKLDQLIKKGLIQADEIHTKNYARKRTRSKNLFLKLAFFYADNPGERGAREFGWKSAQEKGFPLWESGKNQERAINCAIELDRSHNKPWRTLFRVVLKNIKKRGSLQGTLDLLEQETARLVASPSPNSVEQKKQSHPKEHIRGKFSRVPIGNLAKEQGRSAIISEDREVTPEE